MKKIAEYDFKDISGYKVRNIYSDEYHGIIFSCYVSTDGVVDFGLPNVSYACIKDILYSDYNMVMIKFQTISDYGSYIFTHNDRNIYIDGLGRIFINNTFSSICKGYNDDIKHSIKVNFDKMKIEIDGSDEEFKKREDSTNEIISDDIIVGCGFDGNISSVEIYYITIN
jgi:hypothetical protein